MDVWSEVTYVAISGSSRLITENQGEKMALDLLKSNGYVAVQQIVYKLVYVGGFKNWQRASIMMSIKRLKRRAW